ncbi:MULTISPECIES: restriction endonuclease subunit S [unclassified Candidatus Tisiphia]|uniref:restriction endonuclease subunit S n=1 Tax=unclassified Candidatus Tisiphia TaxID=2996318 RepID=UPI00312C72C9
MIYTTYKISDIFDIIGETNITNEYINKHKGEYPVYSGQTKDDGIFGYIDSYKYYEKMITWTTYGSAGRLFLRDGKYNIGRNCCGLRLKKDFINIINLEYVMILLENKFLNKKKDSAGFGILPQHP